jgi:hypothetical protein
MPKSPRPSKEVAAVRKRILDDALDIIRICAHTGVSYARGIILVVS